MRALPLPSCALLLAAWAALVAAQDEEAASDDPVARGRALFGDTQKLEYPACAHCHALLPEEDEADEADHLGPGPTLFGSALRAGWRGRTTYADVGEAAQPCAKTWQKRKKGLSEEQRADLVAFLRTHAPMPAKALPARKPERRPRRPEVPEGGDAERGAKLTARHCGGCHHGGEDAISFELKPQRKRKSVVAGKVRGYGPSGKFDADQGSMSFFTEARLPAEDLADIVAHLGR